MDTKQLRQIIAQTLSDISLREFTVIFEGEASKDIRILIVSNFFKGMNLTKRIAFVLEKLDTLISSEEYFDYSFTVNPLTPAEKDEGLLSETQDESVDYPTYRRIASGYQSLL